MATMRAVVHHRYGGPEVLTTDIVERPDISADQLLVEVQAVEACKSDCEMRSFDYEVKWFWLPLRLALGVFRPRRPVLGMYFSGVVAEVGAAAEGFEVGDAVYGGSGLRRGAYAEYLALPSGAVVVPKPSTMTHAEAAAVPLGGSNALHFLRVADVRPGDRVLVNGAGGVIGGHAVQIAAAFGASVTGVDAAHKETFVRDLGASDFVDYRTTDVTTLDHRFDVVFDMVAKSSMGRMLDLLDDGGRYIHGNPTLATMLRAPFVSRFTSKRVIFRFAEESRDLLTDLAALVDEGRLASVVDRTLPMDQAAEAHRLVDTEERVGAIVLAIGDRADAR